MSPTVYLAIPVMAVLTILQTAVLPYFPILGHTPQLPLLAALAWGLLHGSDEGVLWGFVAGFFLDLFSVTPVGLSSLAFMAAIFIATYLAGAFPTSRFLIPLLTAVLATFIYLLVYFILLSLVGHRVGLPAVTALLPLALLHGILVLPVYWLMTLANRTFRPRRVEI